jgi:hypothetical protein
MIKISKYSKGLCNFHQMTDEEWDRNTAQIKYYDVRTITYNSTDSMSYSVQICDKCAEELAWKLMYGAFEEK